MKFAFSILLGALSLVSIDAGAAVQPIDFANRVVGHYVLTKAEGPCASSLLARGVRNKKDTRVLLESPLNVPLTMIRYINRGNVYENIDWKSISAGRVNTTLGEKDLMMIEQNCAHFSCDTKMQVRVRDQKTHVKIVIKTNSVRCEYTK